MEEKMTRQKIAEEYLNKHLEVKYLGNLPYDHEQYNDREHYNTYSNKNYIPPAYRINELYPSVGILSSVLRIDNYR